MRASTRRFALSLTALAAVAADTARSRDGRLIVPLPDGWRVAHLSGDGGQVQARCPAKDAYAEVNSIPRADRTEDLRRYAQRCRDASDRTSRLADRQVDDLHAVQLGDRTAYTYRVTGTLDGLRRVFIKTYVETDRRLVEVLCWTTPSHEDDAQADFDHIAEHVLDAVPASDLPPPP